VREPPCTSLSRRSFDTRDILGPTHNIRVRIFSRVSELGSSSCVVSGHSLGDGAAVVRDKSETRVALRI